jgi:hypothetical protein
MRLDLFFVLIMLLFFNITFVACDETIDSESGSTTDEEFVSGDNGGDSGGDNTGDVTGGDAVGETEDSNGTGANRWTPKVSDTWQWQLMGTINTSYDVDVYDIDLFENSAATIQGLHDDGRRVVCYFSAGSYENWRPDRGEFEEADLGNTLGGWPDERWLDIRSTDVRDIMTARLDLAVQKGCDAVEPDNVDGYTNATGFSLNADDQLDYNRFLASEAHQRGLAVALKNNVEQAAELVDDFDFTINEECNVYDECDSLALFIAAGKPVFNAEYADRFVNNASTRQTLCDEMNALGIRTLVLPLDLDDSFRYSCD